MLGSSLKRNQVDRRVFASSIDLDVKLQTVAFVQLTHPRTLYLERVEELDGARSLVAGQLTLRSSRSRLALCHGDNITHHHEVAGRNLATTIDEGEFQTLTFSQTFKASALDSRDVHKHIFATVFTLDKAEALLAVEELDDTLALANDLRGHAAASASATTGTAKAATTAAARGTKATAAAEAATITAAKAAATTAATAEAITAATAKTIAAATAEAITAATEAATITAAKAAATTAATAEAITAATAKTIAAATAEAITAATAAAHEGIKAFFAEPVALVSAPAATPSIKTHKTEITFASPRTTSLGCVDETRQATGQADAHHARPSPLHLATYPKIKTIANRFASSGPRFLILSLFGQKSARDPVLCGLAMGGLAWHLCPMAVA